MRPVFRRPARPSGRSVFAVGLGGWLIASALALPAGIAQQQLVQQVGQAGAAAARNVLVGQPGGPAGSPPGGLVGKAELAGENALRKVSGQPAAQPGTRTGGVVGRVEQVGENAVHKVIGGAPSSQPTTQPSIQSGSQPLTSQGGLGTAQQPTTSTGSQPVSNQGGLLGAPQQPAAAVNKPATPQGALLGTAQQAGGTLVNKATGSKSGTTAVGQAVTGAKTLAQKAINNRRRTTSPAAAPSQASAPRPQVPASSPAQGWPQAQLPQTRPTGPRPAGAPPP